METIEPTNWKIREFFFNEVLFVDNDTKDNDLIEANYSLKFSNLQTKIKIIGKILIKPPSGCPSVARRPFSYRELIRQFEGWNLRMFAN